MTYRLVMARSAARALDLDLPEAVASAVVEFVTGVLLESPQRVGKPLLPPLDGSGMRVAGSTGSSTRSTPPPRS